ncbi:MAG: sulfotransferase [Deltaproteobacteria bacterium]|nr:sulfotransferase [Deltaproteobacteria bacterium]MBW2401032.1 sulfotransferase [Deltaproteobacteria bacterium]
MAAPKPHRPLAVRAINGAGAGLRRLGVPLLPVHEERLLLAARKETGLEDFGGEGFREGLRRLVDSLNQDAQLNVLGRISARTTLQTSLRNRLQLQAHLKKHPQVAEQEIREPLFILGLPRTGTTVLFNLLALDPANRAPLAWEVERPCPPPHEETHHSDPRIESMQKQFANLIRMAPNLYAIHEFGAELPQECVAITGHEFLSVQFHIMFNVARYQEWLDRQSALPALEFHRRFLQHLQSEFPRKRWVLKTPGHLAAIDDLLEVYPDARIIHTHRDPVDVMPSLASLSYALRGISTDALDPHFVGRQQTELWAGHLERALRARERTRDRSDQFFDVQFEDVAEDPIAVIERSYAHFGIPFHEVARQRMQAYLAANPRGKYGAHRYSLDDFGLDRTTLQSQFSRYCEHFGIPTRADSE